jgi:hypothetical protein
MKNNNKQERKEMSIEERSKRIKRKGAGREAKDDKRAERSDS